MSDILSTPVSVIGNVHSRSPSNSVLLVIDFNQTSRTFIVLHDSTVKDLKERVSFKWSNDLSPSLFELSFELEGKSKHICSDYDLQSLVYFAAGKNIQYVRVFVVLKHMSSSVGFSSDSSSSFSSSSSIVSDGENIVPYLAQPKVTVLTHVGQSFEGGAPKFRLNLLKHCFFNGYDLTLVKNEPGRITAECVHKVKSGCQWRVHASTKHKKGNTFFIKNFNSSHTCGAGMKHVHHPIISSKLVGHVVSDLVKDCPAIKPKEIIAYFRRKYGVELSYYYAFKGRELSLIDIHGDDPLSYHQLVWYIDQLNVFNRGSICVLEKDEITLKFQRVFIAFRASIQGFNFCRPLVYVDATHLTGTSKGVLLSANGKNGNQGIFQLAIAIVDTENIPNWVWFMQQLKSCIGDRKVIFSSDRHVGLITSVRQVFPSCLHSYCFWHLEKNLLSKIPKNCDRRDDLIKLFKVVAHANTVKEYEDTLKLFNAIGNARANAFVASLPLARWQNAFFPGVRYGETSSSLAESFNSWILHERTLPITALVDSIRRKVMTMFNDRRQASIGWATTLCPRWEEELDARIEYGKSWSVLKSSDDTFEILAGRHQRVNLLTRTCSCNAWQVEGFPCVHAVRCINSDGRNAYDFCDQYFQSHTYRQCYALGIEPVPSVEMPMEIVGKALMLPPDIVKKPGRPKVKRIGSYRISKRKGDIMPPKAYGRNRGKKPRVSDDSDFVSTESNFSENTDCAGSEKDLPAAEIAITDDYVHFPSSGIGITSDYAHPAPADGSPQPFSYSAFSIFE